MDNGNCAPVHCTTIPWANATRCVVGRSVQPILRRFGAIATCARPGPRLACARTTTRRRGLGELGQASRPRSAPGGRQGSQAGCDRLLGRAGGGDRLDRAGLLAGRGDRDRGRGRGAAGAGRAAGLVRPDVPDRGGLLLHEPRRPGLRHQLLLDHPRDRPGRRLGRRLRGLHHRPDRDRLARRRRRVLHLRHRQLGLGAAHLRGGRAGQRAHSHHAPGDGDHHRRDRRSA